MLRRNHLSLKRARGLPLYSLDEPFEVYGGYFGFVQKLVDAAERTSACTDMPEEPNSCWNTMELVGSPFVGPATWAFGKPKGSLLYQMLFRLSLESGFTIKFSTFSRLFIRELDLYSWICTGELLQKQQFLDLLRAHAAGLTEEFSTTFFVWMLAVLHSSS